MTRRNQSQPADPVVEKNDEVSAEPAATDTAEEQANESQPADPVVEAEGAEIEGDGTGEALPEIGEDEGNTVLALVLSDSVYGKCGEVKRFPADLAPAIAAAGYIDTHPNAVASAGS